MSTFTVDREDDFDFLSPEYQTLHATSSATAFQHPVWLTVLYQTLAPTRRAVKQVITVRDEGRLVLVLPLVRRRRGPLTLIEYADLGVNDYAAPVVDTASIPALLGDDTLPTALRSALGRFDLLRIERVGDAVDLLVALLPAARAKRHAYDTHLIELPDYPEAWTRGLDPHFARHLERKYKRLRPKGERRLRLVDDPDEVDGLLETMRAFRAARFADRRGTDLVQDPSYFRFYCAVARAGIAQGPAKVYVLEVGGDAVAVALDLIEPDRELFVLVGYDVGKLRNYSLGLLAVDSLVRNAMTERKRFFDLTVGDESYKADFGATAKPLHEVTLRGSYVGTLSARGRDRYLQARRLVKRVLVARDARRREQAKASS